MPAEITEWIDPDGVATTLEVDWDVAGRFMPAVEFEADGVPGQPGAYFRDVQHGVREFMLAIDITGADDIGLRTNMRNLVARMDPTRGAGKIRVTSPLGDQREIVCRYVSGLGMTEKLGDASGETYQRAAVSFLAHDPYWYDVSPTSQTFAVDPLVPSFFPIFPLKLTASELAVEAAVDNTGDVETWPVWTVTGPGSVIVLRNLTTSKTISFSTGALTASETLVIDTRPGYKTVKLGDGTNMYPSLDTTSALWPLVRGTNTIRLEMSGVDNDVSSLNLSYWRRYLSP